MCWGKGNLHILTSLAKYLLQSGVVSFLVSVRSRLNMGAYSLLAPLVSMFSVSDSSQNFTIAKSLCDNFT